MGIETVGANKNEQMVQEALNFAGSLSDLQLSLDEYAADEKAGKYESLTQDGFSFAEEAEKMATLLADIEARGIDAVLVDFPYVSGGGMISARFGLRAKVLRLLSGEQDVEVEL